ncbi:hypothetical protein IGI04_013575 [Brassica rapa subsp. trilocularis]|uniref:Uncharacterized protein n=1 Tax=Brassica rapa subsp. trilocularis TaxID=1813537 RepID=A0ABQ7NB67_BRACM|nr:hypothetical protein IGI04_013575 [Brassica rapa subsp. trilocularis]
MAATKMFLIKWYSSSTNLEVFQIWKTSGTTYLLVVWKSSGSRLDFLEVKVVWTSRKSSGLPGSRLDFQEVVWTSRKSFFRSGFNMQSSGSRLEVIWTSCKVVWKSSELPKSLLTKSSKLPGSRLDFLEVVSFAIEKKTSRFNYIQTTYNSAVHETTEIRLKCKSSGEIKLLKLSIDDLTFSRLRLQISKSITKITSALTRRLPGKSSTARRLPGKSSTARRLPNSLAYIRLLQAHRITNESHPPRIVSFYDSMNQKNFRIKILGFFSSLWRESEIYVVFSSQEWKKKKGKSILGALRASNWLFMVVVVLISMAIL